MQKKLLLLGTSNGTIDIINYARSQGIYTIVTDYLDPEHSPGKKVADEYWMINTGDLDILEEKCRKENVNAVFCAVSGFNLRMCMALTKRLGLPFYMSQDIWNKTGDGDKSEFKKICKQCNAPIATDYVMGNDYTEADLEHIIYPVVVKPVDKGGNTGISFCDNEKELIEAIKKVREVSTNPHIIVERKIDGDEWFSTYALVDGEVRFLSLNAMYHEPGYPSYCYSLTTTATRYIKPFLDEINGKIEEVLKEMGCKDGFAWVQVMRDVRVIWGGDATIATIRQNAIPPRAFDICFADRYSIAAINSDELNTDKLNSKNLKQLAERFYNDTYLFDQNACSAPHMVVWTGNHVEEAKKLFWDAVQQVTEQKYQFQDVMAVDKLTALYKQACAMPTHEEETKNNILRRVEIDALPQDIDSFRCAGGYFTEYTAKSLDEIAPIVNNKYQTLAYFGFEKQELEDFVLCNRLIGIDRIVPFGETTAFSLTWDGRDLIQSMSRVVSIL